MLRTRMVSRRTLVIGVVAVLAAAVLLRLTETNLATAQTAVLTAAAASTSPGLDPASAAWADAPPVDLPLTAQAVTYPNGGSVPMVQAQALQFDDTLFVRLQWEDNTADASTFAVEDFSDAVAVEFPAEAASSVPSVCMGQADAGVNIWYWRADAQAGRPLLPSDVYGGTAVDVYPSTEDLFYPARYVGNPVAQIAQDAAQNLVATAFGSLTPATDQAVQARGAYGDGHWAVVLARPFQGTTLEEASFTAGTTTDVAFAVWDGAKGERNGQKAVSPFVRLEIAGSAVAPTAGGEAGAAPAVETPVGRDGASWEAGVAVGIAVPVLVLVLVLGRSVMMRRRS